jgi:hypothetical protein
LSEPSFEFETAAFCCAPAGLVISGTLQLNPYYPQMLKGKLNRGTAGFGGEPFPSVFFEHKISNFNTRYMPIRIGQVSLSNIDTGFFLPDAK